MKIGKYFIRYKQSIMIKSIYYVMGYSKILHMKQLTSDDGLTHVHKGHQKIPNCQTPHLRCSSSHFPDYRRSFCENLKPTEHGKLNFYETDHRQALKNNGF